jgi:flavodoxin/NAD-dependent dihydropyrimidine dehydrogenase PreA subunit
MIINKKTIFYFSGTGNSLQVAKDIAALLGDTELVSIPSVIDNDEIKIEADCVGIVFPVYMWGLPLILDRFVKKIKKSKSTYLFATATYGGLLGNTLNQMDKLLRSSGAKLNAGFGINMPGNYIVMYGARPEKSQAKAFEKEKNKVKRIANIVKQKNDCGIEKSKIGIDRMLAPIMYKKIKSVPKMAKMFYAKDNCNGCGTCQKICAAKNIKMENGKPTWGTKCEQCMACIQYCPKEAIEYGKKTIGRKRYRNPKVLLKELIK